MSRDISVLRREGERLRGRDHVPRTERQRTDDRLGGGGGTNVSFAVIRYLSGSTCWAQAVRYIDADNPAEGQIEAYGSWFTVVPVPGGVFRSFEPFVFPLLTESGTTISSGDAYEAAIAEDSTDPPMEQDLALKIVPFKVYVLDGVRIAEPALKLRRAMGPLVTEQLLPGQTSV